MASFTLEEASCTSLLPAVWPLRMRVNRSAIGSVMLIRLSSPARLRETRNLTAVRDFANLHAGNAELAVHATRATGDCATIAHPRSAGVARLSLQLRLRLLALFG